MWETSPKAEDSERPIMARAPEGQFVGSGDVPKPHGRLRKPGGKRIVVVGVWILLQSIVLFLSAGRTDLPRAWLFAALSMGCFLGAAVVMPRICPEIINQRGERKQGTKWWDRVFLAAYIPLVYIMPLVAGLDIGRFQWSNGSVHLTALGAVMYLLSYILACWAMATNPHFEPTVRIQKERNHQVVTTGPYQAVRHPGYVAAILSSVSIPWIIGSHWAMIPAGLIIFSFIVRTALEDQMLQNELSGYSEYAHRVKYRLLPFVW
jgi:protein-S-isoprenylcysteine O-methyltransferase Ste14